MRDDKLVLNMRLVKVMLILEGMLLVFGSAFANATTHLGKQTMWEGRGEGGGVEEEEEEEEKGLMMF